MSVGNTSPWSVGGSAEDGRPEDDAAEHLAHDPGLPDLRHQAPAQAGEQHHDQRGDEERDTVWSEVRCLVPVTCSLTWARPRPRRK